MPVKTQPYELNGVTVSKTTINIGDEIILSYDGLLVKSGADRIYAYVGYGEDWDEKEFVPMSAEEGIFRATILAKIEGTLNICFKDSAENWDNNSFENYTFKVTKKAKKATVKVEEKVEDAPKASKSKSTKAAKVKSDEDQESKTDTKKKTSTKTTKKKDSTVKE